MKLCKSTILGAAASVLLVACGGSNADEADAQDMAIDASQMIQDQAERAGDVKIEDKKSLSKNQRIANSYLNGMNDIVIALEQVDDKESAERAAKIMAEKGEEFDELAKDMDGASGNRERAVAMIMVSRQQEFLAVQQRMMGSMVRIQTQHPELMKTITDGMQNVSMQ